MLIIRLDHEVETYAILKPEAALDELIFNECTQLNKMSMLSFGQVELSESLTLEFYLPINGSINNSTIRKTMIINVTALTKWLFNVLSPVSNK